jgi:hypothetical protein
MDTRTSLRPYKEEFVQEMNSFILSVFTNVFDLFEATDQLSNTIDGRIEHGISSNDR